MATIASVVSIKGVVSTMRVIDIVSVSDKETTYRIVEQSTRKELTLSNAMFLRVVSVKATGVNHLLVCVCLDS